MHHLVVQVRQRQQEWFFMFYSVEHGSGCKVRRSKETGVPTWLTNIRTFFLFFLSIYLPLYFPLSSVPYVISTPTPPVNAVTTHPNFEPVNSCRHLGDGRSSPVGLWMTLPCGGSGPSRTHGPTSAAAASIVPGYPNQRSS